MKYIGYPLLYSAALLIGSNVSYHVCQRSIPKYVHPLHSIIITFAVALLTSILILPFFSSVTDFCMEIKRLNWTSAIAGLSIVGIVVGHVIFYRAGWTLSTGTLFSYVAICLLLIPIGRIFFSEMVSVEKYIGIIISLLGLYLMTKS